MTSKTVTTCDWCGKTLVNGSTNEDTIEHVGVTFEHRDRGMSIVTIDRYDACLQCASNILPPKVRAGVEALRKQRESYRSHGPRPGVLYGQNET